MIPTSSSGGFVIPTSSSGGSGGVVAVVIPGSGSSAVDGVPGSAGGVSVNLKEWRQVRREQDAAFQESLEIDRRKDREKIDKEQKCQVCVMIEHPDLCRQLQVCFCDVSEW